MKSISQETESDITTVEVKLLKKEPGGLSYFNRTCFQATRRLKQVSLCDTKHVHMEGKPTSHNAICFLASVFRVIANTCTEALLKWQSREREREDSLYHQTTLQLWVMPAIMTKNI